MPVVITALITLKPGRVQEVVDAFTEVSPLVYEEQGCELYAAHTDGDVVFMVERWSSHEDLEAHANGAVLTRLNELLGDVLTKPVDVWTLRSVPIGDPIKGTIQ